MGDPSEEASPARTARADVCDQIGRSVGSLWQRRSGIRPASVSTEYVGDVVRCEIRQGESTRDADDGAEEENVSTLNASGYQHGAQAAVERITGRSVRAFIAKRDKGPGTTQAFILEPLRIKR